MENVNVLTKDGLAELKAELKKLVEVERPVVIQEIKDAREQGDLSENAEFDAAREKQGQIEDRIATIEGIIQHSKVVAVKSTTSKVRVGSTVEIQNLSNQLKETYTIVGSLEADPFIGKISNISPVAVAILDQEKGATIRVNANPKYDIKILSIKN